MKRYHVNPKTGDSQECSAQEGNCPFGTHTLDPQACRDLYERVMADYTIPTPWTKANRPPRYARA